MRQEFGPTFLPLTSRAGGTRVVTGDLFELRACRHGDLCTRRGGGDGPGYSNCECDTPLA